MPFQVMHGDIKKVRADIIVNEANSLPIIGEGLETAIYEAAGRELLSAERRKIGEIAVGFAGVTSAYALSARYILHAVSPRGMEREYEEEPLLRSCYYECLRKAEELGCESIAFPLLSGEIKDFSKERAVEIAISVFFDYLQTADLDILLMVNDQVACEVPNRLFEDLQMYISKDTQEDRMSPEGQDKPAFMRSCAPVFEDSMEECYSLDSCILEEDEPVSNKNSDFQASPSVLPSTEKGRPPVLPPAPFAQAAKNRSLKKTASFWRAKDKETMTEGSLEDVLSQKGMSFQDTLIRMMNERNLQNSEVYRAGNLKKQTFSKIFSRENYRPSKNTVCCLAISMKLSVDETNALLETVGMVLSRSEAFDLAIRYFLEHKIYNIVLINIELDRLHMEQLGQKTE